MPDAIQTFKLPETPNSSYLEIARNCSCLVNVASQMAHDWTVAGSPSEEQGFNWTPVNSCDYASGLFSQFNFENVELIWSNFNYHDKITTKTASEPFGFIVSLAGKAYLIFRGTLFAEKGETSPDFQADMDFLTMITYAGGGNVSRGFWRVFEGLQKGLHEQLQKVKTGGLELVISGHSLGSTLATLAVPLAADPANGFGLSVTAYPQASPMAGDSEFAKYYNSLKIDTYRLVNTEDAVPKSPPDRRYTHVGNSVEFTALYNKETASDDEKKKKPDEGKMHNPCCSYAYALKQVGHLPYCAVNPSNTDGKCIFPMIVVNRGGAG